MIIIFITRLSYSVTNHNKACSSNSTNCLKFHVHIVLCRKCVHLMTMVFPPCRHASWCTGSVQSHTPREAGHDVQRHSAQGYSSSLQEIHESSNAVPPTVRVAATLSTYLYWLCNQSSVRRSQCVFGLGDFRRLLLVIYQYGNVQASLRFFTSRFFSILKCVLASGWFIC